MSDSPPPRSLGIGLIGAGHHGLRYARHLLADVPGAHLAALCRRRPGQPAGLDLPASLPVYTDYRALIADPRVDALAVVAPPALAPGICHEAVHARKPLLVEKPLAVDAEHARRMVVQASHAEVLLMTAQTLRFEAAVVALRSALAEFSSGGHPSPETSGVLPAAPRSWPEGSGSSRRRAGLSPATSGLSPAPFVVRHLALQMHVPQKDRTPDHAAGYGHRGALLELGVHLLDLVRFLTGDEVREVQCQTDHLPPTPDLLASVNLHTLGGLPCFAVVSRTSPERVGRVEVSTSEGPLVADWCRSTLSLPAMPAPDVHLIPPRPTVRDALTAFVSAVRDNTPPPITGDDGLRAVELADACYLSAARGGQPVDLPLPPG